MIFDLKRLEEILNREVIEPMDHRFLNYEVEPFNRVIPTPENIAYEIRTQDASHNVLTFYSPGSNSVASIVTTPARKTESQEKGRLVFNHYRGEYFLAGVWNSSSKAGALVNKIRREMEIPATDPNRQTAVLYAKGR